MDLRRCVAVPNLLSGARDAPQSALDVRVGEIVERDGLVFADLVAEEMAHRVA
jgi:hypothetical protein